ncbi:MAG: type II toxin-antitoxin system RelE/ParE family toxin [Candidatus Obscuribacterales bacterium]|nr:type II toxin-antitoxin system RelE/ParE family toxin [Candidatus Obscuribacterales bacterium]
MFGVESKTVRLYQLPDGRVPYRIWIEGLRDHRAKQKIYARLYRIRSGNLGDIRSVGVGVCEVKIDYGPGYRIYFGQDGDKIIIFLCGGDKSTQDEDIKKAKEYWQNYQRDRTWVDS